MEKWNAEIAPFLYQPLQGDLPLRLLLIHPGKRDDPLHTELVSTTLDESGGRYDALSYTWGSPEDPAVISCGSYMIRVQRNAFDMMLDLRRPNQVRSVWIDAVCINQCSLDERAAQVAILHHIYGRAGATWIWLGRPDGEYGSAAKAMVYAASLDASKYVGEFLDCSYGIILARFVEKSYFFDDSFHAGKFNASADESRHLTVAIVDFLNRPWFSRVWIQQEASLCRDVHVVCGSHTTSWDNIFALAWIMCPRYTETWPDYIHHRLSNTINNIQAVRIIQRARHFHFQDVYGPADTMLSFGSLVANVSRYGATDPRDRIYAMGNIVADSGQWYEVDYRIPWQVLYADVARQFLDGNSLRFLQNAGRVRQEPDTALPSWVPDYSYKEEGRFTIDIPTLWKAGGNSQFPTNPSSFGSGKSKVSPLPKGSKRSLPQLDDLLRSYRGPKKSLLQSSASVRCLMSDEIIYVGGFIDIATWDLETNIARIVGHIRKDMEYVANSMKEWPTYINGDALLDAYKLTLIMSCDARQEPVRSEYVRQHWDEWLQWYEQGCPGYWDRNPEAPIPVMNDSFESSSAISAFRFAVTRHGYFCLVPQPTEIGDEIAMFQSYELAVVLRRATSSLKPPAQDDLNSAQQKENQKKKKQTTSNAAADDEYFELLGDAYVHGMMENEARCINDEFNCKYKPTEAQLDKLLRESDKGRGEGWKTLSLCGQYERIFETLGPRTVRLI